MSTASAKQDPKRLGRTVAECQAARTGEQEFDTVFRVLHPDGKAERKLGITWTLLN